MKSTKQRAFEFARRLARADGWIVGRFRRCPGADDDSKCGPQWYAEATRDYGPCRYTVIVWMPRGEDNINEALATHTCRMFSGLGGGSFIYAVRRLPSKN